MRRSLGLLLVLGLLVARGGMAQPEVPTLSGRVVDLADLLLPNTEAVLTSRLAAHEDSTSNQIVVLTVPSLNGENLEQWATEVFRTWGLGQAALNNGVLVLIARDDRKIRIEVGYGLEGALPDATAGAIIRNEMTPRFRNGDFDGGTLAAVEAIIGSIEGEYVPSDVPAGEEMPWWGALLFALGFGGIPGVVGFGTLVTGPVQRYITLFFLAPFVAFAALLLSQELLGFSPTTTFVYVLVGYVVLYVSADVVLTPTQWMREKRKHYKKKQEAFRKARKSGKTSVVVDGVRYSVPTSSSSGGGGFSGGGGSSGGGGASGGW